MELYIRPINGSFNYAFQYDSLVEIIQKEEDYVIVRLKGAYSLLEYQCEGNLKDILSKIKQTIAKNLNIALTSPSFFIRELAKEYYEENHNLNDLYNAP